MVLILPCRFFAVQELQESFAANLVSCGFDKERAAAAGADKSVNLPNQVFWEQNMSTSARHIYSVSSVCAFVKPTVSRGGAQ